MPKILVIEDDQVVRSNIIEFLLEYGYEVESAENGLIGINKVNTFLPDLIICDIMMPEMNGYEVINELCKKEKTAGIPFIFLSAKAEVSDLRFGLQLGADDYLIKPFTATELFKTIEIRLNKKMLYAQQVESIPEKTNIKEKKMLSYNSHVLFLVGDNPEILQISTIKYINAEGEYSRVFTTDNRSIFIRKLLKEWQDILPEEQFLRIHRSTIINLTQVKKIDKWFNHSFIVHLMEVSEPFIISRRFSSKLRSQFNQKNKL